MQETRREWMTQSATQLAAFGAGVGSLAIGQAESSGAAIPGTPPDGRSWRVGVISARNKGQPQRINGHTWHFAQYLHPTIDMKVAQTHLDPGNPQYFQSTVRNPSCNFGVLPFPDTRISHYYEMFNMARVFREMIRTRVEPVPHQEILEVTAMIYAGAKSLKEKSRLVSLSEVME